MPKLGAEPVAIVGTIVAVLNVIQTSALTLDPGAHSAIAAISICLGALVARAQVKPTQSS